MKFIGTYADKNAPSILLHSSQKVGQSRRATKITFNLDMWWVIVELHSNELGVRMDCGEMGRIEFNCNECYFDLPVLLTEIDFDPLHGTRLTFQVMP